MGIAKGEFSLNESLLDPRTGVLSDSLVLIRFLYANSTLLIFTGSQNLSNPDILYWHQTI